MKKDKEDLFLFVTMIKEILLECINHE